MAFSIPFIALFCLFAYRAPSSAGAGITDPDYYWHVGYGEWIIENGRLPTVDFWSWTMNGQTYRLTQWLGEVFMGFANQVGGQLGTSTLAALLVALTMAASYRGARCYLDNRLAALTVALGCNASLIMLACRPHQFSHLGLAILAWIVASYQCGNKKALYWIFPLFAVWVNLHGGYAFGLVYLGMAATFAAVEAYMKRDLKSVRDIALPLYIALAAGLVATLANPYGWGAWQYAVEIASLKSSSAGIVDEWAATSIKTDAGLSFFIVTSAMAAVMALSGKRPSIGNVLLAFSLGAIGWSSTRLSLMTTILMVPIIASSLRNTAFYSLVFDGEARKYDRTYGAGIASAAVAVILASSVGMSKIDKTTTKYMSSKLPVVETAFMKQHGITGKILNTPEAGGYLIRELGAKVSIDTRLDLYGDRALFELLFAMRGDAGWKQYIEGHDPDVVLINNLSPLRHHLADSGLYRPVFEGPAYTVLIRHGQRSELPTIQMNPANRAVLDQLKT